MGLHSTRLYEVGLLSPVASGADRLLAVSGYASPSMASQLLSDVRDHYNREIEIDLVVGMTGKEGIAIGSHRGFEALQDTPPAGKLRVAYMPRGCAVHTKLYVWMNGEQPLVAFAGSSNFTHNGFLLGRRNERRDELLTQVAAPEALAEFRRIEANSVAIDYSDLEAEVDIWSQVKPPIWQERATEDSTPAALVPEVESVVLPLIMLGGATDERGQVHPRSGLNWGQRPDYGREPNQAYIPVPAQIARLGFFPPRGVQFLVNTDDRRAIIMAVAQAGDKALESPQGNQLIGEYFRFRLGVANGAPVSLSDLQRFGSRFVRFYKFDDETYYMEYLPGVEEVGASFYGI